MVDSDSLFVQSNIELKLSVLDAMANLLENIPIDKLTVSKICDEAGTSRSAFYRNFDDKYSVALWHIKFAHTQGVDQIGRTLPWYEGYLYTEMAFAPYRRFYQAVSKTDDYKSIDKKSPHFRKQTFIETLTKYHHARISPHLLFEIEAVTAMEVAILPRWRDEHPEISIEDKCRWMTDLVPPDLLSLLNTPAQPGRV